MLTKPVFRETAETQIINARSENKSITRNLQTLTGEQQNVTASQLDSLDGTDAKTDRTKPAPTGLRPHGTGPLP